MNDEVLLRKIRRQLRWLNVLVTFFSVVIIVGFIVMGFLLYKLVTFTHTAENKINSLQSQASQSLNVKSQLCNDTSINSLFKSESGLCN